MIPLHREQSQWFTPYDLVRSIAKWSQPAGKILEPAAGDGRFIRAIREVSPESHITAVEKDGRFLPDLFELADTTICEDFLEVYDRLGRFDLTIMNPPYERGLDGDFLRAAMRISRRVVALVRLQALTGLKRYREVWSQVSPRRIALLVKRPSFDGAVVGSPRSDFVIVELVRGYRGPTFLEWWSDELLEDEDLDAGASQG